MQSVRVELGERSYDVVVGSGLLRDIGRQLSELTSFRRCALVVDQAIATTHGEAVRRALAASGFTVCEASFFASEENKNLHALEEICRTLLARDTARNTPLIALGGGITGDTAGFASAVYQRGTPFVQVPTTLLAMVDSSVGGKVAVNLDGSKNMIGAFHQPKRVLIDIDTLATLDSRELRCGLAECLKHGIIGDADLFSWTRERLPRLAALDPGSVQELVARNVAFKAAVVARDETEQGERALLNLGHTFGHAIEGCGGATRYKHGEAVAIGIAAATHFAVSRKLCAPEVLTEIESTFVAAGLPVRLELAATDSELIAEMYKDKKTKQQNLTLIVPRKIGECTMLRGVADAEVVRSWEYVRRADLTSNEG
jgi:3-dehydroquinate synthase